MASGVGCLFMMMCIMLMYRVLKLRSQRVEHLICLIVYQVQSKGISFLPPAIEQQLSGLHQAMFLIYRYWKKTEPKKYFRGTSPVRFCLTNKKRRIYSFKSSHTFLSLSFKQRPTSTATILQ